MQYTIEIAKVRACPHCWGNNIKVNMLLVAMFFFPFDPGITKGSVNIFLKTIFYVFHVQPTNSELQKKAIMTAIHMSPQFPFEAYFRAKDWNGHLCYRTALLAWNGPFHATIGNQGKQVIDRPRECKAVLVPEANSSIKQFERNIVAWVGEGGINWITRGKKFRRTDLEDQKHEDKEPKCLSHDIHAKEKKHPSPQWGTRHYW